MDVFTAVWSLFIAFYWWHFWNKLIFFCNNSWWWWWWWLEFHGFARVPATWAQPTFLLFFFGDLMLCIRVDFSSACSHFCDLACSSSSVNSAISSLSLSHWSRLTRTIFFELLRFVSSLAGMKIASGWASGIYRGWLAGTIWPAPPQQRWWNKWRQE